MFWTPASLGSTWLDILHTDDQSWQSGTGGGTSGDTPNVRIALDELPASQIVSLQGYITSTTDPNEDNVNVWLHDDNPAASAWTIGESDQVSYWLLAQDDPPEPWADLGLRPGSVFQDFEGSYNCFLVKDAGQNTAGSVATIGGYTDTALQLKYDARNTSGNWVQVRCNFNPPLDLSAFDHLRFDWRGDPAAANSMQVGLISPTAGGENIFARGYHHATQRAWWGQMVIPFSFLQPWTDGTTFDPSHVSALFVSVVKDPVDDTGGEGIIAFDNLSAFSAGSRTVPSSFETVPSNHVAAQAAASWLASQQKSTGLVQSWAEQGSCVSHTYDQALALIVFANEGMWSKADALVGGLVDTQNPDGSWFKSRDCSTLEVVDGTKWEGDIAWAIYALRRYRTLGGSHPQAEAALQKGADWLATRLNPVDGCLVIDHTEGTIDAWWALQAAGGIHADDAEKIRNCLLVYYWDNSMGRFKGGRNWWQPYLDNQTWGAAFLKAIGETEKARRALSYARDTLQVTGQGGQLSGFDGQGGPWSIWNEGTAQYIATGGPGAGRLLAELLAQQETNGSLAGSPDEFNGGGVWTTRWHGIAPTAWLYNALCGEPFHPGGQLHCSPVNPSTFMDVPITHPYYNDIRILYANNMTGGCQASPLKYCPDQIMNRGQAAAFMLRGNFGPGYIPPIPTHFFKDDWTKGPWAEAWAEGMRNEGFSAGCLASPPKYCPWDQIPREQAVIFALKLKYGKLYMPPSATGAVFADMTNPSFYATAWAEQAYKEGIIQACGTSGSGKPNFCPKTLVNRGLAAYMIVRAKNLSMP